MNKPIVVLLDNIRSAYNVGSILRTADACGVEMVVCCGYTPYPLVINDTRPRFEASKTTTLIAKTALGAEKSVCCQHFETTEIATKHFRKLEYQIIALEQSSHSIDLFDFKPTYPLVLTLGSEVNGHDPSTLDLADQIIEIPMVGKKESLNVSVAAGIALYQLSRPNTAMG